MSFKNQNETMKEKVRTAFSLSEDSAPHEKIRERLLDGGKITGTNMCVMVCAMIIASVGLNMQGEIVSEDKDLDATDVLKNIAEITGGKYYQADSREKLKQIYSDIDKLEKTKLEKQNFEKKYDAFQIFAFIALALLVLEILVRYIWFRRIP